MSVILNSVKKRNAELNKIGKQLLLFGLVLRVYPNGEQETLFDKTVGCSRLVYNTYLNQRNELYKKSKEFLSVATFKKETLNPLKKTDEFEFLKEVDKFSLECACENVDDAFGRFYKGQNKFPQFKSKRTSKKAYTTKFTNNNITLSNDFVKLPKLGLVKLAKIKSKRNKDIVADIVSGDSKIKKATISKKGNKHYVSLTLESVVDMIKPLEITEDNIDSLNIIGNDLGLKTFLVSNNGSETTFFEKEDFIKNSEKKLKKEQQKLSRKKVGSSNFKKQAYKVAKIQEHIANQRKDRNHKLSTKLANENQVAIFEDLNIKGMIKNHKLAKAIANAGWFQFKTFMKYKLERQGKVYLEIDRWFASSKLCNKCGEKNIALTLSNREWVCSSCNTIHERDENASKNIREEGIRLLKLQFV